MLPKNTTKLFFNPGCALSLYRPENAEVIFGYLRRHYPQIEMHRICCRHNWLTSKCTYQNNTERRQLFK